MSKERRKYDIRISEPRDLPDVLRVMRDNFYHEETMFESLCSKVRITDNEKRQIDDYFDGTVMAAFASSPCVVAVCDENQEIGKIVGVNLTALSAKTKNGRATGGLGTIFSQEIQIPLLVKKYLHYLSKINDEARLFERFPDAGAMWEFYAIAVDLDYRKLGIAGDLMRVGIEFARKAHVSLVFGVFTSIYSKKSAENVGMTSLMEFDLSKYKEDDGSPVFPSIEAGNVATVMVLEIK